jgi:hypothetical protein
MNGSIILQEDVGTLHEIERDLVASGVLEVDGDAPLVAVEREEGLGLVRRELHAVAPRVALGWLHLDDLGTHVAQVHPRERRRNHLGELEDPDAF